MKRKVMNVKKRVEPTPGKSGEGFYVDENGQKQDAAFHEKMLAEGDHAAADAVGKAVMRRNGFSEIEIMEWYRHGGVCTRKVEGTVDGTGIVQGEDGGRC